MKKNIYNIIFITLTSFVITVPYINQKYNNTLFHRIGIPNSSVTCLFAHGLFDSGKQAIPYRKSTNPKSTYLFECPVVTFDFPDSKTTFPWCNPAHTSLGQENEIECLKNKYDTINHSNIILFGISRGAVTALNFTALYNPNIKALILESLYDDLEKVIDATPIIQYSWISSIFKKYNPKGIQPIHCLHKIDLNLPILIICSKQDQRVPYQRSIAVYKALKKSGHNVHLLVLKKGKHAKLLTGKNGKIYQNVTHAFLKHYNLPHNFFCALQGKDLFIKTQPLL